jgi:hypothetical protein
LSIYCGQCLEELNVPPCQKQVLGWAWAFRSCVTSDPMPISNFENSWCGIRSFFSYKNPTSSKYGPLLELDMSRTSYITLWVQKALSKCAFFWRPWHTLQDHPHKTKTCVWQFVGWDLMKVFPCCLCKWGLKSPSWTYVLGLYISLLCWLGMWNI